MYRARRHRYLTDSINFSIRKVHSAAQFVAQYHPSNCSAGMYSAAIGPAEACQPCPRGHFCVEGSRNATRCLPGFMCNSTGMRQPEPCPFGYACPAGSNGPVLCAVGTYALSASVECAPCPNRTASSFETCFCSAGYSFDTASLTCVSCLPGNFCVGGGTFYNSCMSLGDLLNTTCCRLVQLSSIDLANFLLLCVYVCVFEGVRGGVKTLSVARSLYHPQWRRMRYHARKDLRA